MESTPTCGICMESDGELLAFCHGKHTFCKGCIDDWISQGICRKLAEYRVGQDDEIDQVDTWILCPLCRERLIDVQREIKSYTGVIEHHDSLASLTYRYEYRDGKLHGPSTSWYEGGQKHAECTYVDGLKDGKYICWWKNGQKRCERNYVDGMKEGMSYLWYKSGMMMAEFSYSLGVSHGVYRRWYESGRLEEEGQYRLSRPCGIFRSWGEEGNLVREENYNDV